MDLVPVERRDERRVELVEGLVGDPVALVLKLLELLNASPYRRQVSGQLAEEADGVDDVGRRLVEEWESTFDSIVDPISIQDKDLRLVRVNKAYICIAPPSIYYECQGS
jgi:PAS domain-containing protein